MTTGPNAVGEHLLAPSTGMRAVALNVRDLAGTAAYYREALALEEMDGTGAPDGHPAGRAGAVVLGRAGTPLVALVSTPDLPTPPRGAAGLFHTAVLLPDLASLAAMVARAAAHPRSRYVGAADHLVSRSFYFTDPEGNGVELYQDRPREEWTWRGGRVDIDTLPLDAQGLLEENLTEQAVATVEQQGASVGHVHLKVGDLEVAGAFYLDVLGFELTAEVPGGLFFSAGGYHHHMAVNTWTSPGAGPRAAELGLGRVAIEVPGREDLDALAGRLRTAGVPVADDGRSLRFEDPWSTALEVRAPQA